MVVLVFTGSKAVNEETVKIRQEFMLDSNNKYENA